MTKLISIKIASKLLGVTDQTLRNWEKIGKIESIRTVGKHRRYRLEDVERLLTNDCWSPLFLIRNLNYEQLQKEYAVYGCCGGEAYRITPNINKDDIETSYSQQFVFRQTKLVPQPGPMDVCMILGTEFTEDSKMCEDDNNTATYSFLKKIALDSNGLYWFGMSGIHPPPEFKLPLKVVVNKPVNYFVHNLWSKVPVRFFGEEILRVGDSLLPRYWLYERNRSC